MMVMVQITVMMPENRTPRTMRRRDIIPVRSLRDVTAERRGVSRCGAVLRTNRDDGALRLDTDGRADERPVIAGDRRGAGVRDGRTVLRCGRSTLARLRVLPLFSLCA